MTNSPVPDEKPQFIIPGEASRIAFLSPENLLRLTDEGKIDSIRPGQHRRYRRTDVEALAENHAAATPEAVASLPPPLLKCSHAQRTRPAPSDLAPIARVCAPLSSRGFCVTRRR